MQTPGVVIHGGAEPLSLSDKRERARQLSAHSHIADKLRNEMFDVAAVLREYGERGGRKVSERELVTSLKIYRNAVGRPISDAELDAIESTGDADADLLQLIRKLAPELDSYQLRRVLDACRVVGAQPGAEMGFIALAHVYERLLVGDVARRAVLVALELAKDPTLSAKQPDVKQLVRESVDDLVVPRLLKK